MCLESYVASWSPLPDKCNKCSCLVMFHLVFYSISSINKSTQLCSAISNYKDIVTCTLGAQARICWWQQVSVQQHIIWAGVCLQSLSGWSGSVTGFRGRGSMWYYSFLSVDLTVWSGVRVCVIDVLLTCFCEGSHAPVQVVLTTHLLLTMTKSVVFYPENRRNYSGTVLVSLFIYVPLNLPLLSSPFISCYVSFYIEKCWAKSQPGT